MVTAASLIGLAMFLLGAFAGQLISIELIAVFHISFLSLSQRSTILALGNRRQWAEGSTC